MYKQIIIARKDLNMSPGKLATQVSHASIAFLTSELRDPDSVTAITRASLAGWHERLSPNEAKEVVYYNVNFELDKELYEQWILGEFTKCVLRAKNKNHLLKAKRKAEEIGLKENEDFWLVYDNCHTELEPEDDGRTLTCIGFKPFDSEVIDKVGRKYQLY